MNPSMFPPENSLGDPAAGSAQSRKIFPRSRRLQTRGHVGCYRQKLYGQNLHETSCKVTGSKRRALYQHWRLNSWSVAMMISCSFWGLWMLWVSAPRKVGIITKCVPKCSRSSLGVEGWALFAVRCFWVRSSLQRDRCNPFALSHVVTILSLLSQAQYLRKLKVHFTWSAQECLRESHWNWCAKESQNAKKMVALDHWRGNAYSNGKICLWQEKDCVAASQERVRRVS